MPGAAVGLAALGALANTCAAAQPQPGSVVVSNAMVIDVASGTVQPLDILIREGKITGLRPAGTAAAPAGAQVVDARGLYAIPGLWDMHIHVTNEPELAERMSVLLLANGVTAVRDTGGALERLLEFRARSHRDDTFVPRTWISGPILDGLPPVWSRPNEHAFEQTIAVGTPEEALRRVDKLADAGVDFIKSYEMLRPEVLRAIVGRAHERGLKVTGHIPIRMTTPDALASGLDGVEHLRGMEFDCASDPQQLLRERVAIMDAHDDLRSGGRELRRKVHEKVRPGAFAHQEAQRCAALIASFAENGTWHTPTLNIVAFRALRFYANEKWTDSVRYVPPALQARWRKMLVEYVDESKYAEWRQHGEWTLQTVGQMHRAGVRLLVGTDAPALPVAPGFSVHDELQALVRAGLSPQAALQAATLNAAQFLGVTRDLGAIQPGKLADLVLLEANPLLDMANTRRIRAVIFKGRVHDRAELDRMLAELEKPAPGVVPSASHSAHARAP